MRLAVLSDTHGNAVAFEAVIQDLKRQSPDGIVFLGDIVMRGPQPQECIDMLRSLHPLAVVRGNYDHMFTRFPPQGWTPQNYKQELVLQYFEYDCRQISEEDQAWLAHLPTEHTDVYEGVRTEMYHADPYKLSEERYPWATNDELDSLHKHEDTALVLYGHMHHAFSRQVKGRTVVNCGSVGLPFDGDPRAGYVVIDLDKQDMAVQIRRVTYDTAKALEVAKARQMPGLEAFEYALRYAKYPYSEARPVG